MSDPRDEIHNDSEEPRDTGDTGALSDAELDELSSRSEEWVPKAAGGAKAERAQRSWIVKNSEQETPDSQGP